jgi:hypothetical protein
MFKPYLPLCHHLYPIPEVMTVVMIIERETEEIEIMDRRLLRQIWI